MFRIALLLAFSLMTFAAVHGQLVVEPDPNVPANERLTLDPTNGVWKTPDMRTSDTIPVPIRVHNTASLVGGVSVNNWAGAIIKVHVLDSDEVDVDGIVPSPGFSPITQTFLLNPANIQLPPLNAMSAYPNPFGDRSDNVQSQALTATFWHPNAFNTGTQIPPASGSQPLITLKLHAKNTDRGVNSDADLSVMAWNIFHVPPGTVPFSSGITLNPSDRVYGTPNFDPQASHLQAGIESGQGQWFHLDDPKTFHFSGPHITTGPFDSSIRVPGSSFYATMVNPVLIGIEHVPEPAEISFLAAGLLCCVMGFQTWWKKRRKVVSAE